MTTRTSRPAPPTTHDTPKARAAIGCVQTGGPNGPITQGEVAPDTQNPGVVVVAAGGHCVVTGSAIPSIRRD